MGTVIRSISFDPEVFQAMEAMRGTKPHFRSGYINSILKEKLGLPERQEVKK